jgi:hypothetical protein
MCCTRANPGFEARMDTATLPLLLVLSLLSALLYSNTLNQKQYKITDVYFVTHLNLLQHNTKIHNTCPQLKRQLERATHTTGGRQTKFCAFLSWAPALYYRAQSG